MIGIYFSFTSFRDLYIFKALCVCVSARMRVCVPHEDLVLTKVRRHQSLCN